MIKKIDIMGIGLDNYTVRESMRQVENYLSNDVLNTIENISMQMLIASETDPVLHNVISELDLSVIGEKEILKAADADSMQRVQETEQNDFSYEFYRISFFCYITGKLLLTKTKRKNHLVLKSSASVFKKQGKSKKIA